VSDTKRARHELERKLADALPDGRRVWDPAFVALYQLEPTWATAVICYRCLYVAIVPSIPSRPIQHTCSQCGLVTPLAPPPEVLEAVRPGIPLVDPRGRRLVS
jgi:hypothetical protein